MTKPVVVTTCSANHLAQAKGLAESLMKYNPGAKLMVGLVDKLEGRVEAGYYKDFDIVEAEELSLAYFDKMRNNYDVFEFNCALKVFFAEHALQKYGTDKVIFLDTDMLVFDSLEYLLKELDEHSILLTPHIWSAFPGDNKRPFEREMLKNGIYNAGFFAVRYDEHGIEFLEWWKARMVDQCYVDLKHGMFVDQKWLNLVPIFFKGVKLLDHPGCNVAYWNLHERTITKEGGKFLVNERPLLFYHYSGYSMNEPELISRHQDRKQMKDQPALQEIFFIYQDALVRNGHDKMLGMECYYKKQKSFWEKVGLRKR